MPPLPSPERLAARSALVGEGMPIRRALPHRDRRMVGAWCFLDHAGPVQFAAGQGLHVGAHPHIGLQTFTWLIEGEVMHRDSLGHEQIIRPGQVNLMTAGNGVTHTEDSVQDGQRLHAAQLWIALPDAWRHCAPAFHHHPSLPTAQTGGFTATVLAGTALGHTAPTQVHSPLLGLDLSCTGPARTHLTLDPAFEHGVLVLRGSLEVAGQTLLPDELLYFAPGHATLDVQATEAAQALLLGGTPFDEDILLWWNFVARTPVELEQAQADWASPPGIGDRFGPPRAGSAAQPLPAPSLDGLRFKTRPPKETP